MKLIPLTLGQFAKVDDDDYEWLMQFKWHADWNKSTGSFYARRTVVLSTKPFHTSSIRMHRAIMHTPTIRQCDHIDHDTLNNQKSNLRNCTSSQNMMNRKSAMVTSKTGVLGVSPHGSKYVARIRDPRSKRYLYLGIFTKLEDAAQARLEAEKKYYKEYASHSCEDSQKLV